jgi:NADH-quinone oxidoreductase subunit K
MLTNYLLVSAILFSLGTLGFLTRRNLIVMFLCAEMMLQGVTLNLVAFGQAWGDWHGPIFAIFVLTVAAAEAGIALALVLSVYRRAGSLDVSLWQELREPGLPPLPEDAAEAEPDVVPPAHWPQLTPAGLQPELTDEEAEEAAHV